jgi:uncharacterized membrane protein
LTEQKSSSIARLELFSDGVLAIVVTIMALELKLPELHESVASRWSYGFLIAEAPKLLSYALAFYVVGTTWVAHLQLTRQLQHTSIRLISLNLLYLFCVSLLPAATAFLGNHPTLPQAVTLWSLVVSSIAIVGGYMIGATAQLGVAIPRWVSRRNRVAAGLLVLAVIGAQLSAYLGWVVIFLGTSLVWIPGRLGVRVFGPPLAADAVIQRDESANGPGQLSDGRTETDTAAPVSGPDS